MPRTMLTDEYWSKLIRLMLKTGRVYDPLDFDFPASQYCYLQIGSDKLSEQLRSAYDSATKDLAQKVGKEEVKTVVKDETLSLTAAKYCRFI